MLANGRIATLDSKKPQVTDVAMVDGRILAVGDGADLAQHAGPESLRLPGHGLQARLRRPGNSTRHFLRERNRLG